jgi:flavin-dependent thymidylate synthase
MNDVDQTMAPPPRASHENMSVDLIDYTGKGFNDPWYAASLMIWTKRTRTEMSPGGLEEIRNWPNERKIEELKYMAATVPSSWEMCDFTFLIKGVTRAFTHQFVRTRTLSFAQQAMQVQNMASGEGWSYLVGPTVAANPEAMEEYEQVMRTIASFYARWVETPGMKTEDVRGALPTNVLTNIVVKGNLRAFCDLIRKRVSPRNQGEFVDVLREMKARMLKALPWVDLFINREADRVAQELYRMIEENIPAGKARTDAVKRIDQLLTNLGSGN